MKTPTIEIYGITEKNQSEPDKPNEDALYYDSKIGLMAVADGVTRSRDPAGRYPPNSLVAPNIFISETKTLMPKFLAQGLCTQEIIRKTFEHINQVIFQANQELGILDNLNYDVCDLLGTTGLIALISEETGMPSVTLGFIGDVMGILLPHHGSPKLLTRDQLEACHAYAKPRFKELAKQEQLPPEIAQKRRLIWQRSRVRNNKLITNPSGNLIGFGVLTGEENALAFVEIGMEEIRRNDRLIFSSDSLDRCAESEAPRKIEHFANVLKTVKGMPLRDSAHYLLNCIREREKQMKRLSDDATVIVVDVL